ncbi:MAG: TolB family protein, partial [Acidothermaceae bacterium]
MTRALEQVLAEFLLDEADQIPPTVGAPYERLFNPGRQPHARHRHQFSRRQLIGPAAAAAAVIVVAAGAVIISGSGRDDKPSSPAGVAPLIPAEISIPATVPSVLTHPMPRAALFVQTGTDSDPNAVSSDPILVSPDGLTYRRVPTAADGAAPGTVSLSAFALSPDGTRLAYGDWTTAAPAASTLHVVDLTSGHVSSFPMPGSGKGEQISNVTWSPDGTRIAYSAANITVLGATGPGGVGEGQAVQDDAILDLATGGHTPLPATPFAWSSDGQQLLLGPPYATGNPYPDANALEIVDSTGKIVRKVPTGSLLDVQLGVGMWSSTAHAIATVSRGANPDDSSSQPHDSWSEPHQYNL